MTTYKLGTEIIYLSLKLIDLKRLNHEDDDKKIII